MAEIIPLEKLEESITLDVIPLDVLKGLASKDLVQIGSTPTPEPKPAREEEPSVTIPLSVLEASAPQVGTFGALTPFPKISEDDLDRDLKWYTNFFNALYANTIPAFKSAMAELSGDHDKAKFIQQEVQKLYDTHSKSAFAGGIASSVLTTAAALGGAALAGPGSVVGGLILASYLGYHALMGAGQTKGYVKEYEELTGKDVSAVHETAATIGGGLTFLVAEKMGAKWLMKSGLLSRNTLKEIGKAWIKKDTKQVTALMLKNIPQSMLKGGLVEGGEESFEQVMGNFIQATYNPEARDFEDMIAGLPEAALAGGIAGAILGGGITVAQTGSKKTMTQMGHDLLNVDEVKRVTTSLKEKMPAESDETISSVLTYVSARARAKGIELHEFTEQVIPQDASGVEQLKDGGRLVVDALTSPNVLTLFESLGDILRADLTTEELTSAEKLFNIKDGKWTKTKNKQFVELFTTWLRTGKTKNKQLKALFNKVQKELTNFYDGALVANKDLTVSKEIVEFFDSLFMKENDILYTDPVGEDKKSNILFGWGKKLYDGILDKVDVQFQANRRGWKHLGLPIKKRMSIQSNFQREGSSIMAGMFDSILLKGMNTRKTRIALNKFVFLYEDKAKWNALSDAERGNLQEAYDVYDTYQTKTLQQYKDRGVLQMGFVERVRGTLGEQLLVAESKKQTPKNIKKVKEIKEALGRAERLKYVHIPLALWMENKLIHDPKRGRDIIAIMATKKRKTLFIADIVDTVNEDGTINEKGYGIPESEVRLGDILASQSTRKGRDFSNLDIREAAIKDKQIMLRKVNKDGSFSKVIPNGFALPAKNLPFLFGYVVRPEFASYMAGITRMIDTIGLPSKVLNIAKMTAFWNPLFLPMYDSIQAAMLGSFNPLRPIRSLNFLWRGWQAVRDNSDINQIMVMGGRDSTPFANPLRGRGGGQIGMLKAMTTKGKYQYRKIYRNLAGEFLSSFLNPIKHAGQLKFGEVAQDIGTLTRNGFGLKTIYNFSWKTAWMLDNTIRAASTIYLHDTKHMSWEDASQRAALFHGDYAGVPTNTRRHLNRIFFTPTFKIAMGKLYINLLSGFGNSLHPTVKSNQEYRENRMSVIRLMAVLGAWDMLMLTLGYDRDEWGRRYVRTVDTDEGPKESTITWSGPHNLFLKYLYRAQNAMGPAVDSSVASFFRANKWELHPLYRVALEIADNRKPNGDSIVGTFDSSIFRGQAPVKEVKQVAYMLRGVVTILKLLGDEFEDPKARAQLTKELQQTAGMILGTAFSAASRPFTFTYIRDIESVRAAQALQSLGIYLSRDLNNLLEKAGTLDPDVYEVMVEEYLSRVNEVLLDADLMEYDLDPEPQ